MMKSMGFSSKFSYLIYVCIFTPSFSIIINEFRQGYFTSNRGLKQGDPLSPYLFPMIMEYISVLFELELIKGNITLIYNIEPMLTHLLCIDDTCSNQSNHSKCQNNLCNHGKNKSSYWVTNEQT
jgi:hypothetical protein